MDGPEADALTPDLYVMTPTILGSLLLPFLGALFYLSNSTQRRQSMFILVALAVIAGLAQSVMQATIHVRSRNCVPVPCVLTSSR
jgi:hypothetical protein